MNRLDFQRHRLFGLPSQSAAGVRHLVVELGRPADWAALGQLWRRVQTELNWPAPAIAVSGTDAFQLWFSFSNTLSISQVRKLGTVLCEHFLEGMRAPRLRLWPDESAHESAPNVPGLIAHTGNWSAFIAPDLAPVFVDTPWLDIPPGEDGQAELLVGLNSVSAEALQSAWEQLTLQPTKTPSSIVPALSGMATGLALSSQRGLSSAPREPHPNREPSPERRQVHSGSPVDALGAAQLATAFLLDVMEDTSVELSLRMDAAKALLAAKG